MSTGDFQLEPLLRALAAAFKARNMARHVNALRVFYAGYAQRTRASVASTRQTWSEDDVIEWLRIMRIAPFDQDYPVLPGGAECPQCQSPASVGFVVSMWSDGSKLQCHHCATRWLVQRSVSTSVPALSARKPQR